MKYESRLKFLQQGLTNKEIDAIERLPDLLDAAQSVVDNDLRSLQIVKLIRLKYSLSEELRIRREVLVKIIHHITAGSSLLAEDFIEFLEYNAYVEECIAQVPEE